MKVTKPHRKSLQAVIPYMTIGPNHYKNMINIIRGSVSANSANIGLQQYIKKNLENKKLIQN